MTFVNITQPLVLNYKLSPRLKWWKKKLYKYIIKPTLIYFICKYILFIPK